MNKNIGKLLLRIGLGGVLLWFGINQLLNPEGWIIWIDNSIIQLIPISLNLFITLNGFFEIIIGTLLLLGVFTRSISILISLHLLGIIYSLGYNDISVRDAGLAMSALALFFLGPGKYNLNKVYK